MKNLFAYTEQTPEYPGFISVNEVEGKDYLYSVTVRSQGHGGEKLGTIELSGEMLLHIAQVFREKVPSR